MRLYPRFILMVATLAVGLWAAGPAGASSISVSATDWRTPSLSGSSGDRSATRTLSLISLDSTCTLGVDSCSFEYSIRGQASADKTIFANTAFASLFGDVDFYLTLGPAALWDVTVDVTMDGVAATDGGGPAVVGGLTLSTPGQPGLLSLHLFGTSAGEGTSTQFVNTSDSDTALSVLPGPTTITVFTSLSCKSTSGECFAGLGLMSPLDFFDLDNTVGPGSGVSVSVTATPHLDPIPEPTTLLLLGTGLAGLGFMRRRKKLIQ